MLYICTVNEKEILCPVCKRKGRYSLLGKAEHIDGYGALLLWCKKCREQIRIPLDSIRTQR